MPKKELRHSFAKNVKAFRLQQGLSQEALAAKSGLHRTYISDIEREERNISLDNIEKIAMALNVSPSVLLENDHENSSGI